MKNSFWREVIDHIPGLVLLFRVDENEDAHLIFANSEIQSILGYTPEEFVLASETSGSNVQTRVTELVEKIAELSHEDGRDVEPICRFYSKRAAEYSFTFEFRIFSVKSSELPFIAVTLEPVKQEGVKNGSAEAAREEFSAEQPVFAAESPLMKALMHKVDAVVDQPVHLLFRGDRGTGKRTLARQIFSAEKLSGAECVQWDLSSMSATEQNEAVEEWCDKYDNAPDNETKNNRLTLLIIEISKLSQSNQQTMLEWLRDRQASGKPVRVIATTRALLEEQMKRGRFSMELYYLLSFDTILLPPLSQRKEDIRLLVESWVPNAASALGLGNPGIPEQVMERLLHHDWPDNFHEFFNVMRRSLLQSDHNLFRLSMEPVSSKGSKSEQDSGLENGLEEIVMFDEMNRRYLDKVLRKTEGKIYGRDGAAHLLGMKPTTLQSKLKKLGVR